jgi:hypothetical protein
MTQEQNQKTNSGLTLLLCAAQGGHAPLVKWLLKECVSHIGDTDIHGNTALMLAVTNPRLVYWLLTDGGAALEVSKGNIWLQLQWPLNFHPNRKDDYRSFLFKTMLLMNEPPPPSVGTYEQLPIVQRARNLRTFLPIYKTAVADWLLRFFPNCLVAIITLYSEPSVDEIYENI